MNPWLANIETARSIAQFVDGLNNVSGYFKSKYRALADPNRGRRLWGLLEYELRHAGCQVRNKEVLDAGCGTGYYSVIFALLGARVKGIDYFEENIRGISAIANEFGLPIEVWRGDVASSGLHSSSTDLVYCTEAISHFHDPLGFLTESARVLRKDGVIIIGDGNNGANAATVRSVHELWMRSECGPFTPEAFKHGEVPFLFRRWMIIRRVFPEIGEEDVFQLGMRTAGLGGDSLIAACKEFVTTGRMPNCVYRRGMSQRRPEDEQRNEEPLSPIWIAARMKERQLLPTIRPHFGFGRGRLFRWLNSLGAATWPLAIRVAPRYLVFGVRQ